jgi:hypothetical protein
MVTATREEQTMFIDDIKFRYTYLNSMKNVVWEQPIARPVMDDMVVVIHPDIGDVLDKLMRERPTWRFKCKQDFYGTSAATRYASAFDIYDGDEALGRLWADRHWRDNAPRFYFNNFRLRQQRQRSTANYTAKPDVAVKRIVKAFHLKTPSERAVEAFSDVHSCLTKLTSNSGWSLRRAKGSIEQRLYEYAEKHWDEIKHHLTDDTTLDLPAMAQAHRDVNDIVAAYESQGGSVVRIEDNGAYMVSRRSGSGSTYCTNIISGEELSYDIRSSLGLLKLVENGESIPGVGVRVDNKLYFITDSKNSQ